MHLELTRSTDLALRALRILHGPDERMKRPALAAAIGTTPHFVARVVGRLVARGWVESESGRHGGYSLAVDPDTISVLDVVEAVEGLPDRNTCALRGGPCQPTETCAIHEAWGRARDALMKELAATPVIEAGSD